MEDCCWAGVVVENVGAVVVSVDYRVEHKGEFRSASEGRNMVTMTMLSAESRFGHGASGERQDSSLPPIYVSGAAHHAYDRNFGLRP